MIYCIRKEFDIMKKIITVIMDGFGYREERHGNAVLDANPVNILKIWDKYPHTTLDACGEELGYNEGQIPDGKLNYMTIAAGHKLLTNKELVDDFLDKKIEENEEFLNMISYLKETEKNVHIMGLFSSSSVHSHMDHFIKIYDILRDFGINNINFNLITDGKNTKNYEFIKLVKVLEEKIEDNKDASIGTICGRYYAMDRSSDYELTKNYYELIVNGRGVRTRSIEDVLKKCYDKEIDDEIIPPIATANLNKLTDNDVVIWMNYRSDSSKQILEALTNPNFNEFNKTDVENLKVYTFFNMGKGINAINFLDSDKINNPLGVYLSKLGLTQVRIAEEDKFNYITSVFDCDFVGQVEGCTRYQVPSQDVKSYDKKPQMSAVEITKKAIGCMQRDVDFILVNYANADSVAHTGNYDATCKAVMAVDLCLNKLVEEAEENFYTVFILGSHGNAEEMKTNGNEIITTHTLNKVPFIVTDPNIELEDGGSLCNVAPTILEYMDIALPNEMQETESLIKN
ncbi:MAG: phosphoglycerate mutase (2,3-diphosphoglycerate-independent) [Firmicutes bacterium]|nr:phosphoglycerate mutase (2,3-diphosphoglycerate-independent) [Bacillota bacterium]